MREQKTRSLLKPKISEVWSEAVEKNAINKVAQVAYTYDREKDSCIKSFTKSGPLTAGEFKDLMRRNFEIYLTPEETGALMHIFDTGFFLQDP